MTRDDQQRHLDALNAELAEMCEAVREIRHDRDLTQAWLEGHDAGYDAGYVMGRENRDPMMTERCPEAAPCILSCMVDGVARPHCRISRLPSYEPLASKAIGPAGLALSEDGAPEQDGAPPEEYWDYL